MLLTFGLITLLASLSAAALTSHHKVRHKHNLLSLRSNHISEIRDAFDAYQNVVDKTQESVELRKEHPLLRDVTLSNVYDDEINKNLNSGRKHTKLSESGLRTTLAPPRPHRLGHDQQIPKQSEYFVRHKRVQATTRSTTPRITTTLKATENYDDEYDDDDNDTTNRRQNDDALSGSARFSRDVSFILSES